MKHEPGSLVTLQSGGPPLTVMERVENDTIARVGWFDRVGNLNIINLPDACLVTCDGAEKNPEPTASG